MDKQWTVSASRSTGLVLVALAWAVFLTLTGSPEALLFTVPVFLLAGPLAFGRYTGEGIIAAIRESRPRLASTVPARYVPAEFIPALSRLVAGSTPVRGPPVAAS